MDLFFLMASQGVIQFRVFLNITILSSEKIMPKTLEIEVRNKNFGPIKYGFFIATQIAGIKVLGIGDGLFAPPRYLTSGDSQFGLEVPVQAVVNIVYKDGKTQTLETPFNKADALNLHTPGITETIRMDLLEDKNYFDIQSVILRFQTPEFGHSRSSGGGMSTHLQKTEIGSASISGQKIDFYGKIVAAVSLSERWDLSISNDDLSAHKDELIEIEFLVKKKDIDDVSWKNVELVDNWRSALAPFWSNYESHKDKQNIFSTHKWVIPIKIFEPGKEGWVVGINDGSCLTENMKKHYLAFKAYSETESYKAERQAFLDRYYGKKTDTNIETAVSNIESTISKLSI